MPAIRKSINDFTQKYGQRDAAKATNGRFCEQRKASAEVSTFDEKARTIRAVMATETPVLVPDYDRWEMVEEILLMSGARFADQVPLLDSHDDDSIMSQVGSTRDIRIEGSKMTGTRHLMDSGELAEHAISLIRGGHLRDGSIRYQYENPLYIEPGQTVVINGRMFEAKEYPLRIAREWRLIEDTICPIGADQNAKMRQLSELPKRQTSASSAEKSRGGFPVNPKLFQLLIKRGLAHGSTTAQAEEYFQTLPVTEQESLRSEAARLVMAEAEEKERAAAQKIAEAERKELDINIRALCQRHACADLADKLISDKADMIRAQELVLETVEKRQRPVTGATQPTIEMGETDGEKTRAAITDAILIRAFPTNHGLKNPAAGNEQFRYRSLYQIGEELLNKAGVSTRHMTKAEVVQTLIGRRGVRSAVTDQTTASFSSITENVMNKAVMLGASEQPGVWNKICSIGSTADFKSVSRVALSDNADLPLKREGAEYHQSKFSDKKETGSIGTYADETILTEEAIINDDLSALTAIPRRKGAAAMRVPETLLFAALNTPPTLTATGLDWFSTSNSPANDIAESNGLTSANLQVVISRMKRMTNFLASGESSTGYLDIFPKFVLVHTDYDWTLKTLLLSGSSPASGYNAGVINPAAMENLVPLSSPRITTTTNFFAFADPNIHPVAEMLFLDGRAAPEAFLDPSQNIDGLRFRIRIRVGFIPLEFRTAIRHRNS